jgi:hypothetical protein
MIKGAKNIELYTDLAKQSRRAMTFPLLKLISHQIATSSWSSKDKQVLWTLFSTAFYGSFRFGELVSARANSFNKNEDLLWTDILLDQDHVAIRIKISKNKTPSGETIDLFEQAGSNYCPVKAIRKLKDMCSPQELSLPVFSLSNGSFLTTSRVNETLFGLLQPLIGDTAGQITGHSFRAALPSALASCPEIASQNDISQWGRWSSDSYLLYTRLKTRQKRLIFAKIISALKILE